MSNNPGTQNGDAALQERITSLEAELAFQGDSVRDLNDALATQQQDLLTLQRQVHLLGQQLRALREGGVTGTPNTDGEKPPHY